jgi:uncharacterized protein YeeX (DUF496 family)
MADEHDRIYRQNEDQYSKIHDNTHRISLLETEVKAIKTDLIGVSGQNGLRGEVRAVTQAMKEMKEQQSANLKWYVGTLISVGVLLGSLIAIL